jgi:hypothetical protein
MGQSLYVDTLAYVPSCNTTRNSLGKQVWDSGSVLDRDITTSQETRVAE